MSVTTYGELLIEGLDGIQYIDTVKIENVSNQHPKASFEAVIDNIEKINIDRLESSVVTLKSVDQGKSCDVFTGYIENIEVIEQGLNYYKVAVVLISKSIAMDVIKKYRSFQDVSKKYSEIMKEVGEENGGIIVKRSLKGDTAIGMPLIQYNETNWEFIKRLASQFREPILVDEMSSRTQITIGEDGGFETIDFEQANYSMGISPNYYKVCGRDIGESKRNYLYYTVKSKGLHKIGKNVTLNGGNYVICQKSGSMVDGELIYNYTLGYRNYLQTKPYFNERLTGCTILGEVVNTQNETVEIKLDLRDEEETSTYYKYNWTPEAGNLMYCMPIKGSTVSLYFADSDEKSAVAINCIRKNGESCSEIFDNSIKSFVTEDNKMLALADGSIHFLSQNPADEVISQLSMIDEQGAFFITKKKFTINTEKGIAFDSKRIYIEASIDIGIRQCGDTNQAYIGVCFLFDILGKQTVLEFYGKYNINGFGIINDVPEVGKKKVNWGKIFLNVALGLAVVAVAVIAVAVLAPVIVGAIASVVAISATASATICMGAAVGAGATGLFAVGRKTLQDIDRGEASNTGEFLLGVAGESLAGAVEGGLCAAVGPVKFGLGLKTAVTTIGKKIAVQEVGAIVTNTAKNVSDGKSLDDGLPATVVSTALCSGIFDVVPATATFNNVKKAVSGSKVATTVNNAKTAIGNSKVVTTVKNVKTAVCNSKIVTTVKNEIDNLAIVKATKAKVIDPTKSYFNTYDDMDDAAKTIGNNKNEVKSLETSIDNLKGKQKELASSAEAATTTIDKLMDSKTLKEAELEELKNLKKELNRDKGNIPGLKKEMNKLKYKINNSKIAIAQKEKSIVKYNKIITKSEKIANKIITSDAEKKLKEKLNKKIYMNTIVVNSLKGGVKKYKDEYGFNYLDKGKQKKLIKNGVKAAFKYFEN